MSRDLTKTERNLLRHYLQVLSEQARSVRNAVEPETGVMRITIESWRAQWAALTKDLDSVTEHLEPRRLGLIGHDSMLIQKLARRIWHDLPHGTMVTPLRETADHRGFYFEVQILDPDKKLTGRIARVQITLDRVEQA